MAKNYTVSFNITGAMDGSLLSAIQSAQNALKGLNKNALAAANSATKTLSGLTGMNQSLNAIQQAANKFRELKKAAAESQQALANAQKQAGQFARQSKSDAKAVETLQKKYADLSKVQSMARQERATDKANATALRNQLKEFKAAYAEAKKLGDASKMVGLTSAINTTSAALNAQRAKIKETAQAYKDLADKVKQSKIELRTAEASEKLSGQRFESARSQAANLKSSLQRQLESLQRLRSQLGAAGFNTSHFAASERQLQSEIERVNQSLQRQQQLLQARQNFSAAFDNLGTAYGEFQNALQTAQTLMNPFKAAAENAMTFEKAMSRLKSLTQMENIRKGNFAAVNAEMSAMADTIERLGASTEYTANEVVGAANFFAMSGWNEKQIRAALPSTVDLASITQVPIARVADMFSDDLTIMGIKAGEQIRLMDGRIVDATQHFADQISFAVSKANLNYEQLHNSLTYNAPAMRLAGLSRGDILAANMIAANAGLKGSVSGTAFRTGIIRIMAPAKKGAEALEELGLSATESQKAMAAAGKAMSEIGIGEADDMMSKIAKIKQRYDELGAAGNKEGQASLLNDIIGKNAFSTWANLMEGSNLEQMKQIAGRLNSSEIDGWAKDMASVMRDNTQTAVDYLTSALDALQRETGKSLSPAIRQAAEAFTPLIQSTAQWVAQNPRIVQTCAAVATGLATATVAVAGFSLAMAGVRFAQEGFKTAALLFKDLGRSAIRAASAMRTLSMATISTSLSSGLTSAATAMKMFGRSCLIATRAALAFVFTPIGAALTTIALAGLWAYENWDRVAPVLNNIADTLSGVMSPAIESAMQACRIFADTVGNALAPIMPLLNSLASYIGGGLAGAFITLGGIVASVVSGIVVGLAGLIKTVAELGTGISKALEQFSKGDYSGAFKTLSTAGTQAAENFKQAHLDALSAVEKGIAATSAAIDNLVHMPKLPNQEVVTRHRVEFDETGTARSAPVDVSDVQAVDTSQLQATVNQAAASMEQVNTPSTAMASSLMMTLPALAGIQVGSQLANAAFSQVASNSQQTAQAAQMMATSLEGVNNPAMTLSQSLMSASPATQALAASAQAASTSSDALSSSAINATGGVDALSNSAIGSTGNIDALSGSASNASGSVLGLGSAAQSAISALMNAASSAVSSAWSAVKSAIGLSGSRGGGFAQGGFVDETTTYYAGEHGREVIIPLTEHHERAQMLWRQAGRMLGILPEAWRQADWSIKRMPRIPNGLKLPRVTFPQMMTTMPTPTTQPLSTARPSLSDLLPARDNTPPIVLNLTVNISGNADAKDVQHGVECAIPAMRRSFAEELSEYQREQKRRSFR